MSTENYRPRHWRLPTGCRSRLLGRAGSDTLRAYFLILDGKYDDGDVLGIAYYNTSMAFFGETIDEITGGVTQPSREKVEATVFRHEFGHNLGLVNNGTPM